MHKPSSVNGGRLLARHLEGRQVRLDAQPVKDSHDGAFAGVLKGFHGDFLRRFDGDPHSFYWAFHFFTLFAWQFCRFVVRSAIRGCRYVMTTLCNSAVTGETLKNIYLKGAA